MGNGERGQTTATRERITANRSDAVGDGDRGQATSTRERRPANRSHAVGDDQIRYFFSIDA